MTVSAAKKTATTARKRTASKPRTAPQTAPVTVPAVVADPDVYVAPTGLSEGFQGDGSVTLTRKLNKRAFANLTELAREGNTPAARKYWNGALRRAGVLGETAPDLSANI